MDQLIYASFSHIHYWYEVGMLKVPASLRTCQSLVFRSYYMSKLNVLILKSPNTPPPSPPPPPYNAFPRGGFRVLGLNRCSTDYRYKKQNKKCLVIWLGFLLMVALGLSLQKTKQKMPDNIVGVPIDGCTRSAVFLAEAQTVLAVSILTIIFWTMATSTVPNPTGPSILGNVGTPL